MSRSVKTACVIGEAFGLIYLMINAGVLPPLAAALVRAIAVISAAGLVVLLRRAPSAPTDPSTSAGFNRGYWLVVAAEVVAGIAGLRVINGVFHDPDVDIAWISLVVGVHFFALAAVWRLAFYTRLGAAITASGAAGLVAGASGASIALIRAVAGLGPGALLVAVSLRPLAHGESPRSRPVTRAAAEARRHPA